MLEIGFICAATLTYFLVAASDGCSVPVLRNGHFAKKSLERNWSWKKLRYQRRANFVKIAPGTILPFNASVFLSCHKNYSFQGTDFTRERVSCNKGRWQPDPVCLPVGDEYIPKTTAYNIRLVTSRFNKQNPTHTTKSLKITTTKTNQFFSENTFKTLSETMENKSHSKMNPPAEECYCEYPILDKNVVAHVKGKRLEFLDKVRSGSVVVFRCKHVGFHQFRGNHEIKCEDCRKWHSSEFPSCTEPRRGSTVILYDTTLNISLDGNLEARKGQTVKLMCVAMESTMFPHWDIPTKNGITKRRLRLERESSGDIVYVSHLSVDNLDVENEGSYGCAVGNNSMNLVNLVIAADKKCKEFIHHDLLSVYYTNNRNIGSKATFRCPAGARLVGASSADCLLNETWSNPVPSCVTKPCTLQKLFFTIPENAVFDEENLSITVPHNTTVKLMCTDYMIVEGNPVAKCSQTGEWEFENFQCISGCPPLVKPPESTLLIKPKRNSYKLGEIITFSCPPGMNLNTESQLIMCLKSGWSEKILPQCEHKLNRLYRKRPISKTSTSIFR